MTLRIENLAALRMLNLRQEDLARQGKHPALETVTLAQLLATWAVHDLTHLHQISRVVATNTAKLSVPGAHIWAFCIATDMAVHNRT